VRLWGLSLESHPMRGALLSATMRVRMRPDADSCSTPVALYGYAYAYAWRFTQALGR
jgi:hypothetical protein